MSDENKNQHFQMRVDAQFGRMIDDLRKAELDLPSRAEMLRRLVEAAHAQLGKKGRRS